ncbi:MAG: 30S ribosome-binding factor RbfA [Gammaproteobacteria bacterium]
MAQKNFSRADRVAQLIHHELASAMLFNIDNPAFKGVTVTAVKLSRDLSSARVYVTFLNDENIKENIKALKQEAGFLRHLLAGKLNLRIVPQLMFFYDESIAVGRKLSALIDTAVKRDTNNTEI